MSESIGFIGLGAIGRPMAAHLAAKGFDLWVHDADAVRTDAVAQAIGARSAPRPADLAAACGIVVTMLPDSPQVEAVCFGEQGLAAGNPTELLVINTTSMDPDRSRDLAARAATRGMRWLEAPVTRGTAGAEAARLCYFIGGEDADLERARPALEAMGSDLRHVGGIGEGLAMKMVHNAISITTSALLGEAVALGERWGLDPQRMHDLMLDCNADSYQLRQKLPRMRDDDFGPGFAVDLAHKDLGIILERAQRLGAPMPLVSTAREVLGGARARGLGNRDTCATVLLYRADAGVEPNAGGDA
jgi:3-hydroxyisobutyrate dehydrogenase-like beta-hydroxyacid dehydrogenase